MFQPDFLIIPRQIYSDRSLAPLDREVFAVVYWMERLRDGVCTAANETIAQILVVKMGSVANALKKLEERGYIKRTFRDKTKRNRSSITTTIHFKQDSLFDVSSIHQTVNRGRIHYKKQDGRVASQSPSSKLRNKKMIGDDEISIHSTDEDGNEMPSKASKSKLPKVRKSQVALGLQRTFLELCRQHLSTTPVLDNKGYFAVLYAMNKGGLTEKQILDLFEEWFMNRRLSDDKMAQITWALSGNNITAFKARNQI